MRVSRVRRAHGVLRPDCRLSTRAQEAVGARIFHLYRRTHAGAAAVAFFARPKAVMKQLAPLGIFAARIQPLPLPAFQGVTTP